MEQYIVYQGVVISEKSEVVGRSLNNEIILDTLIRLVFADSIQEALGKFVEDTRFFTCKRKIDPIQALRLSELKTLK